MQDLHVPGNRKYKGSRLFLYRDNRSQQRVFRGRMQCVSKGRCSVKAEDERILWMSWADQEIMDSPEFQKERQKELDKHTAEAMNCFLLISVDYLYRNYHCKRKGVLKYLEFVLHQMHFAQKDEEYFQLMNEELEREVGVNVLGTLKGE